MTYRELSVPAGFCSTLARRCAPEGLRAPLPPLEPGIGRALQRTRAGAPPPPPPGLFGRGKVVVVLEAPRDLDEMRSCHGSAKKSPSQAVNASAFYLKIPLTAWLGARRVG